MDGKPQDENDNSSDIDSSNIATTNKKCYPHTLNTDVAVTCETTINALCKISSDLLHIQ